MWKLNLIRPNFDRICVTWIHNQMQTFPDMDPKKYLTFPWFEEDRSIPRPVPWFPLDYPCQGLKPEGRSAYSCSPASWSDFSIHLNNIHLSKCKGQIKNKPVFLFLHEKIREAIQIRFAFILNRLCPVELEQCLPTDKVFGRVRRCFVLSSAPCISTRACRSK